jgi:hypothetical protein
MTRKTKRRRPQYPGQLDANGYFPGERFVTIHCDCARCGALLGDFAKHLDDGDNPEVEYHGNTFKAPIRRAGLDSDPMSRLALECVACQRLDIQVSRARLDSELTAMLTAARRDNMPRQKRLKF